MVAKILTAIFNKLISKERLLAQVFAFALGAACTALGVKTDSVLESICVPRLEQMQSQLET